MDSKCFYDIQKNAKNYLQRTKDLLKQSRASFGKNYYYNYYLPKDFNFDANLTEDFFHARSFDYDKTPLLLSDTLYGYFTKMEKVPVNSFYQFVNKDNKVIGQFLANVDKKKNITLFTFTLIQNSSDIDDVTIKLDMLYQGKKWISLCRLDSKSKDESEGHINYYTYNKIYDDKYNAEVIVGPHFHYNCLNKQVLSTSKVDYFPAYGLTNEMLNYDGTNLFESCLNYFANHTGLQKCINIKTFVENKSNKQNLFENPIFLYSKEDELANI